MLLLVAAAAGAAEGTLSTNQRIASEHLGYDLQYRVYLPAAVSSNDKLPTLYVTDGQAYLARGKFKTVLDEAIEAGRVQPIMVVFLDSRLVLRCFEQCLLRLVVAERICWHCNAVAGKRPASGCCGRTL